MVREHTPRRSRSRFCGHHPQVPLAEGPGDLRITGAFCRVRVRARRVLPSQPDASCAFPSRDRRCGGLFRTDSPRPRRRHVRTMPVRAPDDWSSRPTQTWLVPHSQLGKRRASTWAVVAVVFSRTITYSWTCWKRGAPSAPHSRACDSPPRTTASATPGRHGSARSVPPPYPSGLLSVPEAPSPRPFRGHDEGPEDAPMRMLLVRDVTEAELDAEI